MGVREDSERGRVSLQRLMELEQEAAELRAALGLSRRPSEPPTPRRSSTETAAYQLVARYASDMISVHAADGRYAWVSDSCASFGWSPDDLIGHSAYEFIHPDDHGRVLENHRRHASIEQPPRIEYRFRTTDAYRWVSSRTSNSKDETGLPRIVSITRDVSEERTKLEELRRWLQQQQQADPKQGDFIPVCAWCKSVREAGGDWVSLEDHLERSTGQATTHGICPQCVDQVRRRALVLEPSDAEG